MHKAATPGPADAFERQHGQHTYRDPNSIEVDLSAIESNFARLRARPDVGKIVAVVKADAYGHGAIAVARRLADCGVDYLAAGSLLEAVQIRQAGIVCPMIVLGSVTSAEIPHFEQFHLIPSLDSRASAESLMQISSVPLPVFIKVDCGFGRFGIGLPEAAEFIRFVAGLGQLKIEGVYTHLPFSDAAGRAWALHQQAAFEAMVASLSAEGHCFAIVQSAATPHLITDAGAAQTDLAAGHLLYGMNPLAPELKESEASRGFVPALRRVGTKLVHVGSRLEGEAAASYLRGCRGPLGVVPIGIRHNYRPVAADACMLVNGKRARILRVCLENTILDLDHVGEAGIDCDVTVIGTDGAETITLEQAAAWQRMSPLALLIGLGQAVPRLYRNAGDRNS